MRHILPFISFNRPVLASLRLGLLSLLIAGAFSSCSRCAKAKIELTIEQAPFHRIIADYVEADRITQSDTLALKNFRANWKVAFTRNEPYFIRLRSDAHILATLLVAPGEKVQITGKHPGFSENYTVLGSEGSELCRQLNASLAQTSRRLDSLYNQLDLLSPEQRSAKKIELGKVFIKQKQKSIAFIIKNMNSLSTAMALYQNVSNQIPLFGSSQDLFLFQAVRDSLSKRYPSSSYVKALSTDIKRLEQSAHADQIQGLVAKAEVVGAPNFKATDRFGELIRLSDFKGKVVILNFWASTHPECRMFQKELKDLNDQYRNRGLVIIQIGLDTDQATWIQAIQGLDLPGIHINDFRGSKSAIALLYNVPRIPYCYIIGKTGDIAHKHLSGNALQNAVAALL